MIIAVTKKVIDLPGKPLPIKSADIAIASLAVTERNLTLLRFLNYHTIEITADTLREIQNKNAAIIQESHPSFISFLDGSIVFFANDTSWTTITMLWSLYVSLDKKQTFGQMTEYIEDLRLKLYRHSAILREYANKVKDSDKINQAPYFNASKFVEACKRQGIKHKVNNQKVGLIFEDVKLGNDTEGHLLYNRILVIIASDGSIDGFFLYFNDFYYSSYWEIPGIVLHPYLSPGYAFNTSLSFLDKNDAISYAEGLKDTVTNYFPNSGIKHMDSILRDFQSVRRYWAGLQHTETDDLSKLIFTEFSKSLVAPEDEDAEEEIKF